MEGTADLVRESVGMMSDDVACLGTDGVTRDWKVAEDEVTERAR